MLKITVTQEGYLKKSLNKAQVSGLLTQSLGFGLDLHRDILQFLAGESTLPSKFEGLLEEKGILLRVPSHKVTYISNKTLSEDMSTCLAMVLNEGLGFVMSRRPVGGWSTKDAIAFLRGRGVACQPCLSIEDNCYDMEDLTILRVLKKGFIQVLIWDPDNGLVYDPLHHKAESLTSCPSFTVLAGLIKIENLAGGIQ